jgi:cerevisin
MSSALSRFVTVAVVVAATAYASPLSTPIYSSRRDGFAIAPLVVNEHPHGSLNNSYIVMFKVCQQLFSHQ